MPDVSPRLSIEPSAAGLTVTGEVDAQTAPALAEALNPMPGTGDVVLDMSGVDFIDSSGLRVLIEAHGWADEAGRSLVIARPSRHVHRLIEMTGLLDHLNVDAAT